MKDVIALAKAKESAMVRDLQGWIRCGSIYDEATVTAERPFGEGVSKALEWIAQLAERDGFLVDRCNGYCTEITYGASPELVMVLGHADVVPLGAGWTKEPFGGIVENRILYGRGASDDKGPTLAAYYALKILKERNYPLKRTIRIVIGGNEESGSRCLQHYFQDLKRPHPMYGFTPDADFPLIYGEKGIMNYRFHGYLQDTILLELHSGVAANSVPDSAIAHLAGKPVDLHQFEQFLHRVGTSGNLEFKNNQTILTIQGKAAHGSTPEHGRNALALLLLFLADYTDSPLAKHFAPKFQTSDGKGLAIQFSGERMGALTMNLGLGSYENNHYSFILNIRYPIDCDSLVVSETLAQHALHEGEVMSDSAPLYLDPSSPFIQTLLRIYQELSGDKITQPMTIGGGTYARNTVNTIAYGMGFPNGGHGSGNIHSPDESLAIDDLVLGTAIYLRALFELANM